MCVELELEPVWPSARRVLLAIFFFFSTVGPKRPFDPSPSHRTPGGLSPNQEKHGETSASQRVRAGQGEDAWTGKHNLIMQC